MRKLFTLIATTLVVLAATATVTLADDAPATTTVRLSGTITAVGSDSVGLRVAKAGRRASSLVGTTVTLGIDASTRITLGNRAGSLADVKVGARTGVQAHGFPGALVAAKLHAAKVQGPRQIRRHFGGEVTAVGADSLTISVDRTGRRATELQGRTITVSVPEGTPITLGSDKTPITLGQIEVGSRAGVGATQDQASGVWTAARVHVGRGNHWFAGKVTAVGSSSITVAVGRTGAHDRQLHGTTVTVPVDGSTRFLLGKAKTPIALGDVKVGDRVGVLVHSPGGDLAKGMTAVRVHVRHPAPVSGSGSS